MLSLRIVAASIIDHIEERHRGPWISPAKQPNYSRGPPQRRQHYYCHQRRNQLNLDPAAHPTAPQIAGRREEWRRDRGDIYP
jgi:hypothetical protein